MNVSEPLLLPSVDWSPLSKTTVTTAASKTGGPGRRSGIANFINRVQELQVSACTLFTSACCHRRRRK